MSRGDDFEEADEYRRWRPLVSWLTATTNLVGLWSGVATQAYLASTSSPALGVLVMLTAARERYSLSINRRSHQPRFRAVYQCGVQHLSRRDRTGMDYMPHIPSEVSCLPHTDCQALT